MRENSNQHHNHTTWTTLWVKTDMGWAKVVGTNPLWGSSSHHPSVLERRVSIQYSGWSSNKKRKPCVLLHTFAKMKQRYQRENCPGKILYNFTICQNEIKIPKGKLPWQNLYNFTICHNEIQIPKGKLPRQNFTKISPSLEAILGQVKQFCCTTGFPLRQRPYFPTLIKNYERDNMKYEPKEAKYFILFLINI